MRTLAPARTATWLSEHRAPAAVAVLSVTVYLLSRLLTRPTSIDLIVYRAEGRALLDGADLYGALPVAHQLKATYPPFAAMLFTAVAVLPLALAMVVVCTVNLVLLAVVADLSARLVRAPDRARTTLLLVAVGVWAEPVYTTLRYGQINLLLLTLVLLDWTVLARSRWRGVCLGLATGLKVTPAIFIVYLLVTRRYRAAAIATATFAATVLAAAAVLPRASWRFWTVLLADAGRVGRLENEANQSVRGWLVRLAHSTVTTRPQLAAAVLVAAGGVATAVLAERRLGDAWGLLAAAVTGLLVSPISWTHHWVWCLPLLALLWTRNRPWALLAAVFWTFAVWWLPHDPGDELAYSGGLVALSGLYVVAGVAFLALTAWTALRAGGGMPRVGAGSRAAERSEQPTA